MHVTDIKKFLRCPRLYQLLRDTKQERFSFFNINTDVNMSIANKLKIETYGVGQPNQSSEDTINISHEFHWIFKARFVYNDIRIRIPLIYINDKHCDLYFIIYAISASEDIVNHKICTEVLKRNGFIVDNIRLIYLNKDYVREDELDDDTLWLITDSYCNARDNKPIIQSVREYSMNLDQIVENMGKVDVELNYSRGSYCSGRKRCEFYETCFPDEIIEEDNSILTLVSSQYKSKMYNEGIRYLKDADPNLLEGNRAQYAQIMADKNGGIYVEKMALRSWMKDNVKLPLSFIDFEWDLFPIPPYKGMKPLDVLPFQYSLHVYDGKELKHYQFVGTGDSRKELVESMLKNVPAEGSVVAYNAIGAEMIRINEFMRLLPEYTEQLQSINDRMIDFAIPFISGLVYDVRMRGAFTLKVIEGIIDKEHSYKELDCGNGIEAVEIYRKLSETDDPQQKEIYLNQLYEYCGLDSYSLYKVYQWLNELILDDSFS